MCTFCLTPIVFLYCLSFLLNFVLCTTLYLFLLNLAWTCLPCDSSRADTLSELLASVRRQGVRAESLLKDGDNLIQRYRKLEGRLQKQADAQSALEGEFDKFNTQAKSTRTWITDLVQPLTSSDKDTQTEEMKHKAQVSETQSDRHFLFLVGNTLFCFTCFSLSCFSVFHSTILDFIN